MAPLQDPVDELFAELIGHLEEDRSFDVQGFLGTHSVHAAALRTRLERLRRVGLVGDAHRESSLVAAMRERFGVQSEVLLPRLERGPRAERSVEELLPSRVVGGRYRILAEIGRGGMGRVFRALDLDLGRDVALKVADLGKLLPAADAAQRQAWLERFLTEAQVTAQLEHPSIVPVHDIGIDRTGELYYTMKLVEGETLEAKIVEWHAALARGTALPTPALVRIVIQVCQAVAFAHERGVMHRDLKPSNVMVGRFGEVQVMDWGLAKLLAGAVESLPVRPMPPQTTHGSRTLAGEVLGTPTHMAPEQARGDSKAIGPATDVFGLGALLYHGLHGSPPNRENPDADDPDDLPPELEAICRRALHASPAQRYESARTLADDLQAFLDQRVVRAYEGGAFAELRKWVRRNRALATAICAVPLALSIGLVTTLFQRARAEQSNAEVLRLGALQDLDSLIAEADELWPLVPEKLDAFTSWISRAGELVKELPIHRATLARKAAEDSRDSRWWAQQLRHLVTGMENLQGGLLAEDAVVPGHGWSIPKRKAFVDRLVAGFAQGGEFARLWDDALPAIRDAYPGLALTTQFGLVPLGPDEESSLWEFADLQTGLPPRREDSKLRLAETMALVFVLLPGGEFSMGAQRATRDGTNYSHDTHDDEGPVHRVKLSPLFLSKFEMTQGQWLRFDGRNPSYYGPHNSDSNWSASRAELGLLNPVEQVTWEAGTKLCQHLGFRLPTEAEWEYAARGGTSTPWWTGSDPASVASKANLSDRWRRDHGGPPDLQSEEPWSDGFTVHASVGSFPANPFGLHDVLGNVWELCADSYERNYYAVCKETNPVCNSESRFAILRGGSFVDTTIVARSAFRLTMEKAATNVSIGVRPARSLNCLPSDTNTKIK